MVNGSVHYSTRYSPHHIRIVQEIAGETPESLTLRRRQRDLGAVESIPGCRLSKIDIGEGHRFLLVRCPVERDRVLAAVEESIDERVQELKRWRDWKGEPVVSVAVSLTQTTISEGRLYNFLPMGEDAEAPFAGYLDAPFFAGIDRRNADLNLPLNETLVQAAAEASVAGALHTIEASLEIPQHSVFDLVAWTGGEAGKIDKAFEDYGSALSQALFVPAIPVGSERAWASLENVSLWPRDFSLLKARDIARYVDAKLVSHDLNERRLERLRAIAKRAFPLRSLSPSQKRLAAWMEAFAESLIVRKVSPRTWSRFYGDVVSLFEEATANLEALEGKRVLIDRSGKLYPAGGFGNDKRKGLYVRSEATKGKRSSGGLPAPPATLTRRYRLLHDKVKLKRETLQALVEADLVREYDPVEALAGLKSVLKQNASDKRRREALLWAFRVWRSSPGQHVESILKDAELFVPTLSGWRTARESSFPASWTATGGTLENYLFEAAGVSPDCARTREHLLIGHNDWPGTGEAPKKRWIEFLEIVGVANGLRPVPSSFRREGSPAFYWNDFLRDGDAAQGFDGDWRAEVDGVTFKNPYMDRQANGEAWRFPGQLEYGDLSDVAREIFCILGRSFYLSVAMPTWQLLKRRA